MISVVIPARNEARSLPATLQAAGRLPQAAEVVVVDDGSDDETARLAAAHGCRVVRMGRPQGKGAALAAGVRVARGRILVFLDADLEDTAALAAKLLEPVLAGHADMAVAAFPAPSRGGFGLVQWVARLGIRYLGGPWMRSPLSGQRAVRREVLEAVGELAGGFGIEVGLTIDALRAGFRVVEVPVAMRHRETGRDLAGFLHRGRQLWHVAGALARRWANAPVGR
ncbi:MAG: glycosyltransferase family 2 protein [Firmicutes bacterium]|nr:glycosyltransferase family 2 protein [Bacillota bacterium]